MDSCEPVEAAKAGNPTSIEGKESSADHVTRSSCERDSERHASFRDLKRWSPIRSYISFSLEMTEFGKPFGRYLIKNPRK